MRSSYIAIFIILSAVALAIFVFASQYIKTSQQLGPQLKQLKEFIPKAEKANSWTLFQDDQEGFTINYPTAYQIEKLNKTSTTSNQEIIKFTPKNNSAGNPLQNFILITKESSQANLKNCSQVDAKLLTFKNNFPGIYHYLSEKLSAEGLTPEIQNNGYTFYRDWLAQYNQTKYLEIIAYKTIHKDNCYKISLTMSLPSKNQVKEVFDSNDKKIILANFALMLSSFKFTQ